MIHADLTPNAPEPAVAPATASARACALAERQIEVLARLAEIGLEVASAVAERARDEASGAVEASAGEPSVAYARVARAVRLTLALQAKISKELLALEQGAVVAVKAAVLDEAPAVDAEAGRLEARRRRIERVVRRVAADDLDNDEDDVERLSGVCWERLVDEDIYGDLFAKPMGAIIEKICEDLQVPVNWYRLSTEAWAMAETAEGDPRSPLVTLAKELERIRRSAPPS